MRLRALTQHDIAVESAAGRSVLLLDADRTLSPVDTGRVVGGILGQNDAVRAVFETQGYTCTAFERVAELWSRIPADRYLEAVEQAASTVTLHTIWPQLFSQLPTSTSIVVATAGIPQVWRRVLERHGLANVRVWGGCHAALDDYVLSPLGKAALVRAYQARGSRVVAAGDSEVDLPMLRAADLSLFINDTKGSPRLRARLHEVDHIHHFPTDARRFAELPVLSEDELLHHIRHFEGGRHAA